MQCVANGAAGKLILNKLVLFKKTVQAVGPVVIQPLGSAFIQCKIPESRVIHPGRNIHQILVNATDIGVGLAKHRAFHVKAVVSIDREVMLDLATAGEFHGNKVIEVSGRKRDYSLKLAERSV